MTTQAPVRAGSSSAGTPPRGAAERRQSPPRPARGARWVLLILIAVGCVHVIFMIGVESLRLARSEVAIADLEAEVAALEAEAAELQAVIEHGDDAGYREQLARRQGFMYPGEVRIVTSGTR